VRDQQPLFGPVTSDATAFGVIDAIAADPALLQALRAARARERERAWKAGAAPERIVIDVGATLITARSEKDGAAGTFKGGFGFHALLAYLDDSHDALAAMLRPAALAPTPPPTTSRSSIWRSSSSRARWSRPRRSSCAPTAPRPPTSSARSCAPPGSTSSWAMTSPRPCARRSSRCPKRRAPGDRPGRRGPRGRMGCRDHRPAGADRLARRHPRDRAPRAPTPRRAAELHRPRRPPLPGHPDRPRRRRGRARAPAPRPRHAEDRVRAAKQTGLENLPFRDFDHNAVWLEVSLIAQDIIAWTQRLALDAELAVCDPRRCATGCCTSLADWSSTPAARRCACNARGPGPANSRAPSPGWPRYHHPQADRLAPTDNDAPPLAADDPSPQTIDHGHPASPGNAGAAPRHAPRHPTPRHPPHPPRPPPPTLTSGELLNDPG
jgi:hypothetical protein